MAISKSTSVQVENCTSAFVPFSVCSGPQILDPLAECVSIFPELDDVGWIRPSCVVADDPPSELAEFFASQNFGRSSEHEHMEQSTRVLIHIYYGIVNKKSSEEDVCVATKSKVIG
jgi:hypothetical protein